MSQSEVVRINAYLRAVHAQILSRYDAVLRGECKIKDFVPPEEEQILAASWDPDFADVPRRSASPDSMDESSKDEFPSHIRHCTCTSGTGIHTTIDILPPWPSLDELAAMHGISPL